MWTRRRKCHSRLAGDAAAAVLGVVAGAVYADDSGVLGAVRKRLAGYPEVVWRWRWPAGGLGRPGGGVRGACSSVVAGRQVRELMRLALLLERRYAPYSKWLGTAFGHLRHVDGLPAHLSPRRDGGKRAGAGGCLRRTSSSPSGTTARADRAASSTIGGYHSRPARVLMADRFTDALLATIDDAALRRLPLHRRHRPAHRQHRRARRSARLPPHRRAVRRRGPSPSSDGPCR